MDVHLRDLRYFAEVAAELSFTRAAERLFVSQPALSKQIRALERHLGFALFDRAPSGVELTAAGAALLASARDLLERWDQGVAAARAALPAGTLVIGMQTAVGRDLQAAALRGFRRRMPGWRISLRLVGWEDPSCGLADGGADVAFVWLPAPAGTATRVLAVERVVVALPEDHPLCARDEVGYAELLGEPFVALPRAAGPLRDFWLGGGDVRVGVEAATADEVFEAVLGGLGVALLAEGNAALYSRPGIVCRPVSGLPPAELAVAWRAGDRRPAVMAYLDALGQAGREARDPGPGESAAG
ncbi:LysR family transcriptional regulator [Bailinhaonella thermotolerans]|uniref:LysR family transcriptional regulator n=1 Tax=Bailinhaonella thermotolerans TaxID=1070861 RepID=A0A3A4BE59_9ACTN|nr:LysR family transcriptional regulator [Bailinhaonella thermotolerans]RJL32580.1 LysR family transcriptional regulator [Bailinhaonella thermotolerans]